MSAKSPKMEESNPAKGCSPTPAVSEAVVLRPLVGVGEHGVCLRGLLEVLLGLLVTGVAIGMELHRQLAVRSFDLVLRGAAVYTEHLVVVALAAHELLSPSQGAASAHAGEEAGGIHEHHLGEVAGRVLDGVDCLLEHGGVLRVQDAAPLLERLLDLLADPRLEQRRRTP